MKLFFAASLLGLLSFAHAQTEPYVYIVYYQGEECGSTAVGAIPIVGDEGEQQKKKTVIPNDRWLSASVSNNWFFDDPQSCTGMEL